MSNASNPSALASKRRPLKFVLLEVILLLIILTPNATLFCKWAPDLISEAKLQPHLLRGSGFFIDVAKYYACAQIARTNPENIWHLPTQQKWFKNYLHLPEKIDLYSAEELSPAQYTPQSIVLFMPLASLPLNQTIVIFELLSFLVLIIPVTLLILRYQKLALLEIIIWWILVLTAAPATENLFLGQLNGFLAGLAALFLLSWQTKNNWLAALALALTIAIKPHRAFVLLIMAVATKKYRLLFATVIFSLLLLAIAAMILGVQPLIDYPKALISIEAAVDKYQLIAPTTLIVSLLAPISIIFGRQVARLAGWFLLPICLLVIYLIWRKAGATGQKTYPFAYASSVLCNFILGPHEHFYDLLLLSVVWAMTIPAVYLDKILLITDKLQRLWCILFVFFPVISWAIYLIFSRPPNNYFGTWHSPLLILMFVLAFLSFKRGCADANPAKN